MAKLRVTESQFRFRVQDPYAPVGGGEATANNSPLPSAATAQAGESQQSKTFKNK